jgi:5-carboxymethyl-2-hydroxymuconic-semialdehyde dehydrogenase
VAHLLHRFARDGTVGARRRRRISTPVSFELGGKSPLIVFEDADKDRTANMIEQYDNAGQVCLAGARLLVQESIAEEMMARSRRKLKQDDPRDFTTKSPLIHPEHLQRVDGFVQRAIQSGARLVYGGKVNPELGGLYYQPTLFTDIPEGAEILQKEVFGPVLTFQTFKDEAEAIAIANNTNYGLAATIFTRDAARAQRISEAVVSGLVWVNCFFVRDLGQAFGGARNSGIGRRVGSGALISTAS